MSKINKLDFSEQAVQVTDAEMSMKEIAKKKKAGKKDADGDDDYGAEMKAAKASKKKK